MNILYVCHRLPFPPKRGGKIRPFNMIAHLAKRHHVCVASIARTEQELEEGQGLRDHCAAVIAEVIKPQRAWLQMLARVPTSVPSSFGNFWSPALKKRIDQELASRPYDLIFVHCSSVARYVEDVTGVAKVLDFGDMDSQKWRIYGDVRTLPLSLVYRLEGIKLEAEEARLAGRFDFCTATTRLELDTLRELAPAVASDWFPNGVDAGFFAPDPGVEVDPYLISFIGRMDYFPNQEAMIRFCRDVLPLVQAQEPKAQLRIVGADPSQNILKLADLPGVTVTGSVPDVRPHVRSSAVNVAPLSIARGTQNKILEAMAMGVPVVSSRLAAKGVDAVPGEHLLTADTAQETADAVLALLGDSARRQALAAAGRTRVLSHHNWSSSMMRLDALLTPWLGAPDPADSNLSDVGAGSDADVAETTNSLPHTRAAAKGVEV